MESTGYYELVAALEWQVELGAVDALAESPVDRFDQEQVSPKLSEWFLPPEPEKPLGQTGQVFVPQKETDVVAVARAAAGGAADLGQLREAMSAYPHCELRQGARNLVFADGQPAAKVMVIGEAPGAEEDREGRPFVGRAGQLLDRMFAAIDMGRAAEVPENSLYITNILPWRPPQNRDPQADEVAMMRPFLERHVALVQPEILVLMGNHACQALLGRKGITRLRGQWAEAMGKPVLPMFHPAYLLRNPSAKREAWADLLALQARLGNL